MMPELAYAAKAVCCKLAEDPSPKSAMAISRTGPLLLTLLTLLVALRVYHAV